MAKQKDPTGYYDPQTGAFIPAKKKKKVWPWIVAAVVLVVIIGAGAGGNKSESGDKSSSGDRAAQTQTGEKTADEPTSTDAAPAENAEAGPAAPDLSAVATEYTLTAGQYYAGIDIPCGKFNLTVISGDGNIMTTNMYSGGVNGIFGIPDADHDYYKDAYNGVKLPEGERMGVWGDLTVRLEYTRIDTGFTGRTEDEANKITLIDGNYDIGDDIPAGLYTIRVTEGSGNVSCNVYGGGLNEIMGAPGTDQSILAYIPEFKNAYLPAGEELTIRGMTVDLIPMIPGLDG